MDELDGIRRLILTSSHGGRSSARPITEESRRTGSGSYRQQICDFLLFVYLFFKNLAISWTSSGCHASEFITPLWNIENLAPKSVVPHPLP